MLQTKHALLPHETHDEFSREEFCGTLRRFFTETLWPGTRDVYRAQQLPAFEHDNGRSPAHAREVRSAMENSFYFRAQQPFGPHGARNCCGTRWAKPSNASCQN